MSLSGHTAAGQAAGYGLQFDVALQSLAQGGSPGARVGIEVLDDVAHEGESSSRLTQVKSSISGATPYADGSEGLWKALSVWGEAVLLGEIDLEQTHLQLLASVPVGPGLAREISQAVDDSAAVACVQELRRRPAKPAKKVAALVSAVRGLPEAVLIRLVQRVSLVDSQNLGALHSQTANSLNLPADVPPSPVIEELLGWIKTEAHRSWESGKPAWIRQVDFNNRLHSTVDKHRRRRTRELPARDLVCQADDVERQKSSRFVRQLEVIDADARTVEEGIIDFLRHGHERLRLTKEGNVSEEDWLDFDDRLVQSWKPFFAQHASGTQTERSRGRAVYFGLQGHREVLAGYPTTEPYLTRGGFHRLADELTVGWHPRFAKLCRKIRR